MTACRLRVSALEFRHLRLQLVDLARQGRLPLPPGLRLQAVLLSALADLAVRRADAPVLEHGQRVLAIVHARTHAHAEGGVHDLAVALCGGVVAHRRREVALGLAHAARRDGVCAGRVRASAHGRGERAARRAHLAHGGGVDARGGGPMAHRRGAITRGVGVGAERRGIKARGGGHVPHRC
eukprot:scaffold67373_cov69-Phaeocystis_antarctica.AAC.2